MTLHRTTLIGLIRALDLSHLTATQRLVLTTIAQGRGHPVSAKAIAAEVYGRLRKDGGAQDAEGAVQVYVYQLRQKGYEIKSRYGWGYALVTREPTKKRARKRKAA